MNETMDQNRTHTGQTGLGYLDIQAAVGISKHMGGYPATDELHRLIALHQAAEVLEIGCGIGVGPVYIAQKFPCQVVAVDISERMLAWARQRARRAGVRERIHFQRADVLDLPFKDNRFDAVLIESVLAFIPQKGVAIQEMIRVTRPGGHIGLNETYWASQPDPALLAQSFSIGTEILSEHDWRQIWDATGLEARLIQTYKLDTRGELRDRIGWIGWRSILPAWGRVLKLMLTRPAARRAIREQLDAPTGLIEALGYGLFVGRKPNL
jgi:SAM-dependent methyltransferase